MGSHSNPDSDDFKDNELCKLQRKLSRKQEEVEELKKLLYIASHDIRSPLISILGFADELEMISSDIRDAFAKHNSLDELKKAVFKILDDDATESIEYVTESVQSLDIIIRSLLTLSRAAHTNVDLERVNMDHLLNRMRMEFSSRMEMMKTVCDFQEALPDCIANEQLLVRIFEIVLENSLMHTSPHDDSYISIHAIEQNENVCYKVVDHNSTLPLGKEPEAFDVFTKLNPLQKEGAGIGLSEARILTRKMNGHITIERGSTPGICVSISLPKAQS